MLKTSAWAAMNAAPQPARRLNTNLAIRPIPVAGVPHGKSASNILGAHLAVPTPSVVPQPLRLRHIASSVNVDLDVAHVRSVLHRSVAREPCLHAG